MTPPGRSIDGAYALFFGALFAATGYGATFVLTRHFKTYGGTEVDTGIVLAAAMLGTLVSVPAVGWFSGRMGAAKSGALGSLCISVGFAIFAFTMKASTTALLGGSLIGAGWGAFYLAAPMGLSQLVTKEDRAYWFTRFAAFQMAGIGLSPFLGELLLDHVGLQTDTFFLAVSLLCLIAALLQFRFARVAPFKERGSDNATTSWVRAGKKILTGPSSFPVAMVAVGAAAFGGVMTYQSSIVEGTTLSPGTYFLVYGIAVVVARWTLASTVSSVPTNISVPALLGCMVTGLAALFFISNGVLIQVAAAALFGLGYGLVYPLIQAQAVNDCDDPRLNDAVLTWFVLSYFIGIFGFPFIGGWIVVSFGAQALITTVVVLGIAEFSLSILRNASLRATEPA